MFLCTANFTGTWCSGITPAQHAGGPGFKPQCVHCFFCCSDPIWLALVKATDEFLAFHVGKARGYGATAARLTPDQKVGSSNLSGLILAFGSEFFRERK